MPTETEVGADITLASTTESQAELDHATSPEWRKHFTPPAAKEGEGEGKDKSGKSGEAGTKEKPATKTDAESDPASSEAKSGKEKESDEGDLPPGARKRIDKLTARLRRTEEELAEARRGDKPASARETVQPKAEAKNSDPEPVQKDFKSWEEWNAAHNRWVVRDEQRTLDAKKETERQNAEAKEAYDGHLARVQSFSAEHDDFEDTVKDMGTFEFSSSQANMAFQLAIVEADNGPEILYHLAKNPDEMEKFAGLSPARVQMLIGRISAKLAPESSSAEKAGTDKSGKEKDKDGKAAAASTEQRSKAPAPTTPVRRSSAAPATDLADPKMDTDEWIRKRNEQEQKHRRR